MWNSDCHLAGSLHFDVTVSISQQAEDVPHPRPRGARLPEIVYPDQVTSALVKLRVEQPPLVGRNAQ